MNTRITPLMDVRNVREAIIHVLSHEFPLSVTQLKSAVAQSFAFRVSYQAIHKEVCKLLMFNIMVRDGRALTLNPKWISQQRAFFHYAHHNYNRDGTVQNAKKCPSGDELQLRLDDMVD